MRIIVGDTHPEDWHPGWVKCLQKHLLKSIRSGKAASQGAQAASVLRTRIADVTDEAIRMQENGASGPEAFDHVLRMLSRALSKVTPAGVMGLLVNFAVDPGTTFATYLSELRLLVANVQSVGRELAPGNGSIQSAVKNGIDDQFPNISAQAFAGRHHQPLPFESVEQMMGALRDFDTNTSVAVAAKRFGTGSVGGVTTRSRHFAKALHSKNFGGIMSVDEAYEEEDTEMQYVNAIGQKQNHRLGKKGKDPPLYEPFHSREAKDAARKAFGPFCLNCGSSEHLLARDCPQEFMNKSGIIHHEIGEGSPQEVSEKWRRWQHRLCAYHRNRNKP